MEQVQKQATTKPKSNSKVKGNPPWNAKLSTGKGHASDGPLPRAKALGNQYELLSVEGVQYDSEDKENE